MADGNIHSQEAGAAHLLLTGFIVVVIIGALGVVGYNSFQRSQLSSTHVDTSPEKTLQRAKGKLDAGDVYALTNSEKTALEEAEVEVDTPSKPTTQNSSDDKIVSSPQVKPAKPSPAKPASSTSLKRINEYSTKSLDLPAYRDVVTVGNNLWFTNANTSFIAKMTTKGKVTKYRSSIQGAYFTPIVKGSDGRVWFAGNTRSIHAMTTDGKETIYPIPSNPTLVESMVLGPDKNVWFTTWEDNHNGVIGKITPSGKVTEYRMTRSGYARGLTVGSDGRVWFAAKFGAGAISTKGEIKYIDAYEGWSNTPWSIARGAKGYVWLLGHDGSTGGRLIRVDMNGKTKDFTNSTTKKAFRLFSGPNGTVWFSDHYGGVITRINSKGSFKRFAAPSDLVNSYGITFLKGNVWVSYASPLKNGATASAGKIVEFVF